MKNYKKLLVIPCLSLMLSGCVKMNTTMTINKDKSMDFVFDELVIDSLASEMSINDSVNVESLKKRGITIKEKSENGYSGISASKKYPNIDEISSEKDIEITISNYLEDNFDDSVLFKVEKGFLKNKYIVNYKYDSNVNNPDDNSIDKDEINDDTSIEEELTPVPNLFETPVQAPNENDEIKNNINSIELPSANEDQTTNEEEMEDYSEMFSSAGEMEFKFTAILPVKPLSSNATSVSEDGKTLTWNLLTNTNSEIKYSFELLNMTNLYILIGGGAVLLVFIIVMFIAIIKKKNVSKEEYTPTEEPIHTDYDPSIATQLATNIATEVNMQGVVEQNIVQPQPTNQFTTPVETPVASEVNITSAPVEPTQQNIASEMSSTVEPTVNQAIEQQVANTIVEQPVQMGTSTMIPEEVVEQVDIKTPTFITPGIQNLPDETPVATTNEVKIDTPNATEIAKIDEQ